MSKPKGIPNLDVKQINEIVNLTLEDSLSRKGIADAVGCSKQTVWNYQKRNLLI